MAAASSLIVPFVAFLLMLTNWVADTDPCVAAITSKQQKLVLFPSVSSNSTILSVVSSDPDLTILDKAINAAGVNVLLSNLDTTYSLFAPTNAVFEKAFKDKLLTCVHKYYYTSSCQSVHHLLSATNLHQLLLNHVVHETFDLENVKQGAMLEFVGGAIEQVSRIAGKTRVGACTITSSTRAINGVVLVVDAIFGSINPLTGLSADLSLNASTVQEASKVADATFFNTSKREEMAEGVQLLNIPAFQMNRNLVAFPDGGLEHSPVLVFDPSLNTKGFQGPDGKFKYPELQNVIRPSDNVDLAYMTVLELGALIRTKQVTSLELVNIFTDRLKRYDDILKVVITYTEKLAKEQASTADNLLEKGIYLGPLHGIPYGLKDIIAVPGYRTTWGSTSFKDQFINQEAWVYQRLKAAGAVLIAKLVTGSLAYDDIWFGGRTRNPWNIEEFSTGSSAGPAAGTSAGLVPFAIGSETAGSITYPAARTGVTAIRPTFGMVGRSSVFSLSKSLDKLGPFCRSAADCAVILDIIRGKDPGDTSSKDIHLKDPFSIDVSKLTVGYLADADMEAQRARGILAREILENFKMMDAFIGNATDWEKVAVGNLVGMPVVVIPTGLKNITAPLPSGTKRRTTITTGIYAAPYHDSEVLALAMAYQQVTKHHLQRPPINDLGPGDLYF
ncbi:hypothetical protein O6H91_04G083000 [Diphasiastrum complanatum]|uniref:Uncharacterized protein n=1 Tax=Diphasiastrum complanatum TaxID=34168 RepID=A0ACC2DZ47_DIPCM|nr:hypothetical protein O6H91_04G083000 [Diphasiastrum complanatum]